MKDRIREVRKDLNMTQTEFGEALGKTKAVIVNYELGRVAPDDTFLQLLEIKYRYRAEWLRTGELPRKLSEPEADRIAEVGLAAGRLDDAQVAARLHELIDDIPPAYRKLIYTILTAPDFPPIKPPTD